ncbi:MAG: DUF3473 domain-containing protein [Pirellulaceae bacterium]
MSTLGAQEQNRLNGFSVDVEDGISIAMRDRFGKQIPQTERVVTLTRKLLELLARHDTRATFFVLGQVGAAFPELVRDIQAAGHEIGVHGHDHHVYDKLTRQQALDELYRAKSVLEDLTGTRICGHRAPAFSINQSTAWVLDLLLDLGFVYDSSIMPCRGVGYGWPGHRLDIGLVDTPNDRRIVEVPLSVANIAGREVPALGGSYFRLLPFGVSKWLFERIQAQRPVIVYLHPYELDPEPYPDFYMAELARTSLKTRLRMRSFWLGRQSLLQRYDRLLSRYRFGPVRDLLQGVSKV